MKGRIRKKRKKQAYVERLEKGNEYLKGALQRQEANYSKRLRAMATENDLLEILLYASVIAADGSVTIKTEGLKEILGGMEISCKADAEAHTVHIEVKEKTEV